jgi:hypothetical protein
VARVRIPRIDDPLYVFIRIISVRNPSGQGLMLRVSVAPIEPERPQKIVIGEVIPFPADHTGVFTIPLTEEASHVIAGNRHNSLIVALAATDGALDPGIRLQIQARIAGNRDSQ